MEYEGRRETQPAPKSMKLVLIRANGALFYSVAAAAVLESQAVRGAARMLSLFPGEPAFCDWLETEWLPRKSARAHVLREYVEQTWPEFDFAAAMHDCEVAAERGLGPRRPGAAHEALARCLVSAQAALFYGCVSRWAEDHRLRELAASFADEERVMLARFRAAYERSARAEGMRFLPAWFDARRLVRTLRDVQLPFVFGCLGAHWRPQAPIAEMSYRDFVRRMRRVVRHRGNPGFAERALFAPWASRPRLRSAAPAHAFCPGPRTY